MKIPQHTLEQMSHEAAPAPVEAVDAGAPAVESVAGGTAAPKGRRLQFSILAVLTLMTTSSLALVLSKPYWPAIKAALTPREPDRPRARVIPPASIEAPVPPPTPAKQVREFYCGPCGQG